MAVDVDRAVDACDHFLAVDIVVARAGFRAGVNRNNVLRQQVDRGVIRFGQDTGQFDQNDRAAADQIHRAVIAMQLHQTRGFNRMRRGNVDVGVIAKGFDRSLAIHKQANRARNRLIQRRCHVAIRQARITGGTCDRQVQIMGRPQPTGNSCLLINLNFKGLCE